MNWRGEGVSLSFFVFRTIYFCSKRSTNRKKFTKRSQNIRILPGSASNLYSQHSADQWKDYNNNSSRRKIKTSIDHIRNQVYGLIYLSLVWHMNGSLLMPFDELIGTRRICFFVCFGCALVYTNTHTHTHVNSQVENYCYPRLVFFLWCFSHACFIFFVFSRLDVVRLLVIA